MRNNVAFRIDDLMRTDVAAVEFARGIDAPDATDPFAVLGVLAGAHKNLVVVKNGNGDGIVAGAAAASFQHGVLGIGVELPEQLRLALVPFFGVEAIDVAVTAAINDLRHATQ